MWIFISPNNSAFMEIRKSKVVVRDWIVYFSDLLQPENAMRSANQTAIFKSKASSLHISWRMNQINALIISERVILWNDLCDKWIFVKVNSPFICCLFPE